MTQPTPNQLFDVLLDTQGLYCPEPVMMLHQAMRKSQSGQVVRVLATDPSTTRDVPKFCLHLGHTLLAEEIDQDGSQQIYSYVIRKK